MGLKLTKGPYQFICGLIPLALFFAGCGDIYMQDKGPSKGFSTKQFSECKLDPDAFSNIFDKNIKGDIECLKTTLHLFIEVVATDRPGYLSRDTLMDFMATGPMDFDDHVADLLDGVFDVSYLLFGGTKGYLSQGNVDRLMDLTILFNERMWRVYRYFNSDDPVNYGRHVRERETVFNELNRLSNAVLNLYNGNRSPDRLDRINLEVFIDKFFNGDPDLVRMIKRMLYLKRVILGGTITELTHLEFADVVYKLPHLGQIVFDLYKVDHFVFSDDQSLVINMFQDDIQNLRSLIFYDKDSTEPVLSIYNIFDTIEEFVDTGDLNIHKYVNEALLLKDVLVGRAGEHFTGIEVNKIFKHVEEVMRKGLMFFRFYDFFQEDLNSPAPISRSFSSYPVKSKQELEDLVDFSRIARGYRFYRGSATLPTYNFAIQRNNNGFFEVLAFEYFVKKMMAYFGQASNNARGGYHLTWDQMYNLLDKIKVPLKDVGIVTIGKVGGNEIKSTTDNFVLMSTLFQYQADGCEAEGICMEVPEATEFLLSIWASMQVKDFFVEQIETICADHRDEYGRVFADCFRKNFIKILEAKIPGEGRSISEYMPLLYRYIKELVADLEVGQPPTESRDYMKFIMETEAFTRTCMYFDEDKTDEVPLKATDAFAVFAGLFSVEATMLKHDANQNNILDGTKGYSEVMNAYYTVYEGAMKSLVAPEGGFMERLAKPIFMYLVQKGKAPDTTQFKSIAKFIGFLMKFRKHAPASRTTIATILKVIGEQNMDFPFKCEECLRDPNVECIPEDGPWD